MPNGYQANTRFFYMFSDIVESGDIANFECSVIRVYLLIKSSANFTTGTAFPSIETICDKTKLSRAQVMRALSTLEEKGYIYRAKEGRKNTYSVREKINITDNAGNAQAVASWDYMPNQVHEAITELKNIVMSGEMVGGKIIHIENLVLNIASGESTQYIASGDNNQFHVGQPEGKTDNLDVLELKSYPQKKTTKKSYPQ